MLHQSITCLSHFSPRHDISPSSCVRAQVLLVASLKAVWTAFLSEVPRSSSCKGIASGMSGRCTLCHHWRPFTTVQVHVPEATVSKILADRQAYSPRPALPLQRSPGNQDCRARQLHTKTVCHSTSSASSATESASIIYATAAGSRHDMPGHSECAARIPAILSALDVSKLTSGHRPVQVYQTLQLPFA